MFDLSIEIQNTATTIYLLALTGLASYTDVREKRIPNDLTTIGIGVSVLFASAKILLGNTGSSWTGLLLATALGFMFAIALRAVKFWHAGDSKLLITISPLFSWSQLAFQYVPMLLIFVGILHTINCILSQTTKVETPLAPAFFLSLLIIFL